jgi:hypothetical protein
MENMKIKSAFILCFVLLLSSCHSVTAMPGPVLENRKFKIVKARAKSLKYGFKLFGFIPIVNPSHSDAVQEIYDSAGRSFEGRAITLANHTQERTGNWFILFSVPKLTVTADIIEFIDNDSGSK